jgi:PAS domain S-box-containing protein
MAQSSELETILCSADGRTVANALLQTTPSIAVITNRDKILRVSRHACELSGLSADQMEGLTISAFFALVEPRGADGRLLKPEQFPLARALQGDVVLGRQGFFRDSHGQRVPIVSNVAPFRGAGGEVIGAINSVTDLRAIHALEAELRAAVAEKEMLYRELAHRVKNHLQVAAGLVALEAGRAGPGAQETVERISGRLQMLAAIYDTSHQASSGGRIQARSFLEQVVQPYRSDTVQVAIAAPEGATLAPDHAGPLGMLVNEAVCNSYKHAFPQRRGRIAVALRQAAPDRIRLEIADDGVGFSPAAPGSASQGLRLLQLLARQLGGEVTISARPDAGATVVAEAPISLEVEPTAGAAP